MSPEAIQSIMQLDGPSSLTPAPHISNVAPANHFGNLVSEGLSQVNDQLKVSQTDLQQLALGDVENLHQVMIRLEESKTSFQLLLQVRGRMLEAYQDVMKMQV